MNNGKLAYIEHYSDIIPDIAAAREIASQALPTTLWTNTLKISPGALQQLLAKDNIALKPLPWNPAAFRWISSSPPGKHWTYWAGLFQIQEEVSMLSGIVLAAKPGEKVLDLCAAPGNKTSQIAVAMQNTGCVIANDRNYNRMRAFGQIMKRLGLINVSTTIYDGTSYPRMENTFDKVLVDAPCSCEGTFRKNTNKYVIPDTKKSQTLARVQQVLLKKAIRLCKPGGKILYSTCPFSPIENENVINEMLKIYGDEITVLPIKIPAFQTCPGLATWEGESFDSSLQNTVRVWPHLNNTGGFYLALLEKKAEASYEPISEPLQPESISEQAQQHINALVDRFAFPMQEIQKYRYLTENSSRGIYVTNQDNQPPDSLRIDATGLFFLKTKIRHPKISTAAAMIFAKHAKKNTITLSENQRIAYFQREDIILDNQQINQCVSTGYVLVFHQDQAIGVGLYFAAEDDKPHRLKSLFPQYIQGG